jgi:hypothetical protein
MTSFQKQNVSTEIFKPAEILTYTVGATAVANTPVSGVTPVTLVEFSGNRLVIPAQAGSLKVAGAALHDGAIGDTDLSVVSAGVWWLLAAANVTAGARLMAAAVGTVTPFVPDASGLVAHPEAIIGIALEAFSSGALGRVKLINLG